MHSNLNENINFPENVWRNLFLLTEIASCIYYLALKRSMLIFNYLRTLYINYTLLLLSLQFVAVSS